MDARITFITSDQSGIIVLLSTHVSLLDETETSGEDKRACLQQSLNRLCVSSVGYPFEEGKPRMLPYLLPWQNVYDAIFWYGMKPAQAKGLVRSQTRQTRSCTTRRHLNLKLSRKSRYSVSLRETTQAGPPTQPKQKCFNQLTWRENIHRNPWAQHEETHHRPGTPDAKCRQADTQNRSKIPGTITNRGSK